MANSKPAEKNEVENTLDVSQFFTMENEEKGVWFEAKSGIVPTGIEFLVIGPNSKEAWIASNNYQKKIENVDDIDDEGQKHDFAMENMNEAVTARCKDIRGKDGKKLVINGKEVTKDDIRMIFDNSPLIALSVWKFCQSSDGFLGKKKKN